MAADEQWIVDQLYFFLFWIAPVPQPPWRFLDKFPETILAAGFVINRRMSWFVIANRIKLTFISFHRFLMPCIAFRSPDRYNNIIKPMAKIPAYFFWRTIIYWLTRLGIHSSLTVIIDPWLYWLINRSLLEAKWLNKCQILPVTDMERSIIRSMILLYMCVCVCVLMCMLAWVLTWI